MRCQGLDGVARERREVFDSLGEFAVRCNASQLLDDGRVDAIIGVNHVVNVRHRARESPSGSTTTSSR